MIGKRHDVENQKQRSEDASGQAFESVTVLENFSAGGLYVRLKWCVTRGSNPSSLIFCRASDSLM